jgi:Flp pilus assembly protein TadG
MPLAKLTKKLTGFVRERRAASAVEFALITPLMLLMYFGTVELSQGVALDRKVTLTARTLSDLVAQSTSISNTDMSNVFAASAAILTPYLSSPLQARVTAVYINAAGIANVIWSDGYNMTGRGVGSVVTVPAGLLVPNTELIWGEASYAYTPTVGYVVKNTINLSETYYARPRQSNTVCRPPLIVICN